jgi:hypothetical protein|tara:strand:+ start:615 stop:779 length:165 start_codon:yes stop_codon:yes gene_type:complete
VKDKLTPVSKEKPIDKYKIKKKRVIYVYSSDDCRVDEAGGPYEVKISDDFKLNE